MKNSSTNSNTSHAVILFDGVCNLCNGYVNFLIRRMKADNLRFGTLQSDAGRKLLENNGLDPDKLNTVFLIQDGKLFSKSDVAIKLAKEMKGGWKLFGVFIIVPKFFRDWIYDLISKNRYRLFGKQEACMIPTPELKKLFLD